MKFLICVLSSIFILGCTSGDVAQHHDLVITNVTILNTLTGEIESHKTIVIDSGIITAVLDSVVDIKADSVLDAHAKLLVPGFIDAVGHLDDVFGDRPDTLGSKLASVSNCVDEFAATYLPYGVTTVRSSGDGTGYYTLADYLHQFPDAHSPDFYFSGGSIAGWYDGTPYVNHLLVQDSSEAEYWINSMYKTGSVSSVKLYCNGAMNYPIFTAGLKKAHELNLPVTSQVQNEITIDSALTLGLRNFEHASTLVYQRNLFNFSNDQSFNDTLLRYYPDVEAGRRIYPYLEAANKVGAGNPEILATILNMKAHNATMTTSLHFFAQWFDKCYFRSVPKGERFDTHNFTAEQNARCLKGFAILSGYVKQMFDAGVVLAIGTDHKDGGKAVLSEILLLHEAGIPMENCFQIATINTARVIGQEEKYGSITVGKRANMIIFDADPFADPGNILKNKTVIKDGVIYLKK